MALTHADMAVVAAAIERSMPSDLARVLGHLINTAGEEARRATLDLQGVGQALSRTSQALPGEPRLAQSAQESIDQAASRLESARRVVFRVVQDLPVITRAIHEAPEGDLAGPKRDVETQLDPTEQTPLGVAAERRRLPHSAAPDVDRAMPR